MARTAARRPADVRSARPRGGWGARQSPAVLVTVSAIALPSQLIRNPPAGVDCGDPDSAALADADRAAAVDAVAAGGPAPDDAVRVGRALRLLLAGDRRGLIARREGGIRIRGAHGRVLRHGALPA